jgi:hypothetical protein
MIAQALPSEKVGPFFLWERHLAAMIVTVALRLARFISPARRASLFFSARSAEKNVCVYLRPSAANINFFPFSRL